jgi:uncharacterized membrane protein
VAANGDADRTGPDEGPWEDLDPDEDPFADLDGRRRRRRSRRSPIQATTLARTGAGKLLIGAVAALLAATIAGLVALWPDSPETEGPTQAFGGPSLPATVDRAYTTRCPGPVAQECRRIDVTVNEGPDAGQPSTITLGPAAVTPNVEAGDEIRVVHVDVPRGADPRQVEPYQFVDYDRKGSLVWLAVGFAALVLLLARWRGLLALVGLGLSLLLVTKFMVPAILAGSSPLLVSLTGALAVMFLTLGLTSGVGAQSLAAALGIGGSLLLATLLGDAYVGIAHLNGYTGELSTVLGQSNAHVSLEGIVVAGIVVGALGVLADMAVTQASAVMALRRANPSLGARELYRGAFVVGRDHLSATIHTLVLAYVGAALPLLLVLRSSGVGTGDAFNSQDVAEPIVATLVGSIGLIAAVPLTTGLAAVLVARVPASALSEHGGHQH